MKKGLLFFLLAFCLGIAATGWSLLYRGWQPLTELVNPKNVAPARVVVPDKATPPVEQISAPANTLDRSLLRDIASTYSNNLLKHHEF
ncbi:MAG TPA: hypothetical protein VGI80_06115, partial [Pyrinomonadaceae bacterium]